MYKHEIDEKAKALRLWVRRKRGNRKIECSGCGRKFTEIYDLSERAVRDLPWSEFQTTVFIADLCTPLEFSPDYLGKSASKSHPVGHGKEPQHVRKACGTRVLRTYSKTQ